LVAAIPVTYVGGQYGANKAHFIAGGMLVMGTGSALFASPHFFAERYAEK